MVAAAAVQVGVIIVTIALSAYSRILQEKKAKENAKKPATLEEFTFQTAEEGRKIPLIFGQVRLPSPNIVWVGDFAQRRNEFQVEGKREFRGFRYSLGVQMVVCLGPVDRYFRIWIDTREAFTNFLGLRDARIAVKDADYFGGPEEGGGIDSPVFLFRGKDDQDVSGYLSAAPISGATVVDGGNGYAIGDILTVVGGTPSAADFRARFRVTGIGGVSAPVATVSLFDGGKYADLPSGVVTTEGGGVGPADGGCTLRLEFSSEGHQGTPDTTPRRGGVAHVVWEGGEIGLGTSWPGFEFEVRRIPPRPLEIFGENRCIIFPTEEEATEFAVEDCNPMAVIFEALTDKDWGLGQSEDCIHIANFAIIADILREEGNGFSTVLDTATTARDLIEMIEDQIDGMVFVSRLTGLWEIRLNRDDYNPETIPQLEDNNVVIESYTIQTYDMTQNSLMLKYQNRATDYKDGFAPVNDMANIRTQDGRIIHSEVSLPGVKASSTVANIAWRSLRIQSTPLAVCRVSVDRSQYNLQPMDVVRWTSLKLRFSERVFRVVSVDIGELENGRVTLDLMQDIFSTVKPGWADPPRDPDPVDPVVPLAPLSSLIVNAPRAILYRIAGRYNMSSRLFYAARPRNAAETEYAIERGFTPPADDETREFAGSGTRFTEVGALAQQLTVGDEYPGPNIFISPSQSTLDAMRAFFAQLSVTKIGTELKNMIYVCDPASMQFGEYIMCTEGRSSNGQLMLVSTYRGVLGTPQQVWPVGTQVYCVTQFDAGTLTDLDFAHNGTYDCKVSPRSASVPVNFDQIAPQLVRTFDQWRAPYAPSELFINGKRFPKSEVSLDGPGQGEELGLHLKLTRRDFRTGDGFDEIDALDVDAPGKFWDYPAAHNTMHVVDLYDMTAGQDQHLIQKVGSTDEFLFTLQEIIAEVGDIPRELEFRILSTHTVSGVDYKSFQLIFRFTCSSNLEGSFFFGEFTNTRDSLAYTANAAGTFAFFSPAQPGQDRDHNVWLRINGGTWEEIIAEGDTTGTKTGVSVGNTIELLHTGNVVGLTRSIVMTAPVGGTDAFGAMETRPNLQDLGILQTLQESGPYILPETGTFTMVIPGEFIGGDAEYEKNGTGGWQLLVSAGNESGTFAGDEGDSVKFRHDKGGTGASNVFGVLAPTNADDIPDVSGHFQPVNLPFDLGTVGPFIETANYVVDSAGEQTVSISQEYSESDAIVQIRYNGSDWSTILESGDMGPVDTATVIVSDIIEFRHTNSDSSDSPVSISMTPPGAGTYANGVFTTPSGTFDFGNLPRLVESPLYTPDAAGTHTFKLARPLAAGQLQMRGTTGSWEALIDTGDIEGTRNVINVGDQFRIRHTGYSDPIDPFEIAVLMDAPSGVDGHGTLVVTGPT